MVVRRERVNRITLVGVIKILIDPRPGVYLVVTVLAVESTRLNVYFVNSGYELWKSELKCLNIIFYQYEYQSKNI